MIISLACSVRNIDGISTVSLCTIGVDPFLREYDLGFGALTGYRIRAAIDISEVHCVCPRFDSKIDAAFPQRLRDVVKLHRSTCLIAADFDRKCGQVAGGQRITGSVNIRCIRNNCRQAAAKNRCQRFGKHNTYTALIAVIYSCA